jgi:very-short-patch-repair endonuclease
MSSGRIEAAVARVARANDGVFSRADARSRGFSDKQIRDRVRTMVWHEILPAVYVHGGTPVTKRTQWRAALVWGGSDSLLSHRCGGEHWEYDGVIALPKPDLLVPIEQHPRSPLVTVHRSGELEARDRRLSGGLRFTSPVRTLIDLAGVLSEEELEVALESARRQKLVTVSAVRDRLEPIAGRGRPGVGRLRALLDTLDGTAAAESILEVKVARLLRATALPEPTRQHVVRLGLTRLRLDFVWLPWRVALECDGKAFHDFQRDRTRWRALAASGWRVLPVTWNDVHQRWPEVVKDLGALLESAA